ncbi:MFS transporter [Nakamurella alba]|nr:MFS transporter [Nakamurella alba]
MTAPESGLRSLLPATRPARLLSGGALLSSVAFFAVMPFGTLYLAAVTDLGAAAIGAVVGSVSLIGAIGGVFGGLLADRIGALRTLQLGLVLNVLTFGAFAVARETWLLITLFALLGVARLLVEPATKNLMSTVSGDARVFRLRYMILCVGAIAGPLIGAALYHVGPAAFFLVPAAFFAGYLVLMATSRGDFPDTLTRDPAAGLPGGGALRRAVTDRRLLAAVAAGAVVFFVFSQLESMVPLAMQSTFGDRTASLFAGLLIANAVLALCFQPLADKLSARLGHRALVFTGAAAFALAFGCFALMDVSPVWLYVGVAVWTVGEGLLLPLPDMAVHDLATPENKGAYFGLAELRYVGFFAGPLAGGALIGTTGTGVPPVYYLVMALAIGVAVPFLLLRRQAPEQEPGGADRGAGDPAADRVEEVSGVPA